MYERPWFPHCSAPLPEQHIGRLDFPLQNIPDNFHAEIIFSLLSSIRGGCLEQTPLVIDNQLLDSITSSLALSTDPLYPTC